MLTLTKMTYNICDCPILFSILLYDENGNLLFICIEQTAFSARNLFVQITFLRRFGFYFVAFLYLQRNLNGIIYHTHFTNKKYAT